MGPDAQYRAWGCAARMLVRRFTVTHITSLEWKRAPMARGLRMDSREHTMGAVVSVL